MESLAMPTLGGEECQQLAELNRRLGAYLGRVQSLEGEHSRLRAELAHLRQVQGGQPSWRARCQEELAALRARLEGASLEAQRAALALEGLREEAQGLRGKCLQERAAQDEARRALAAGKRALEEELRAQLALRAKGAQLEGEREALREAQREQLASLELQRAVSAPQPPRLPAVPPLQPPELEGYARRLEGLWRGALQGYRAEVARLEGALETARGQLRSTTEDGRQARLRLQQLHRELAGLQARKETLEEGLARLWQRRQGGAQELQLAIEELEEEKQSLRVQIAQVLEDRQQLMQLKMSLSLEVATYRSLLEAENTRLQMPTTEYKVISGLWDAKLEANQSKLRDLSLSPFPKPQPAKNQQDPPTVSLASVLPQDRSPVACEFQRADLALQSPLINGFVEVLPFMAEAPLVEAAPQISFHESPVTFGPISPVATGPAKEESLELERGLQEDGGESTSPMEEEENEEPSKEPPGEAVNLRTPYPTQLVTEALETALQEMNKEDPQLGSSLLRVPETLNGIPLEEEEDGAPPPTSAGLQEEEAGPEQLKKVPPGGDHLTDAGEAVVVNGDQETCAGHQDLGTEVRASLGADLALPQETELLEEERGLFAADSQEDLVGPRSGDEAESSEHPSALQGGGQPSELEKILEHANPAALLGQAAPVLPRDGEESREPGPSQLPYEEQLQMPGGDPEESDGGVEDLEVMSTEALHLSEEEEERRDLWSPTQDNEASDLQAEVLVREGQMPPTRCQLLSAESQPKPLFQEVSQCKPVSPQEEVVEPPAVSEEAILKDGASGGAEGSFALAGEPDSPGSTDDAEGPGEGALGDRGSHEDERVVDEERISDEEVVRVLEGTWGSESVLRPEDSLGLEASEGRQREDPREVPEEDLSLQQKLEEEKVGADGGFLSEEWVTNAEATGTESGEEAGDGMDREEAEQESTANGAAHKPELGREAGPAEEQRCAEETEGDAAVCPVPLTQSRVFGPDAATEIASEGQGDAAREPQDEGQGRPQVPTEALPVGSLRSPNSDSASESVDAAYDMDRIEHGRPIALEDTLPDHTPLHVYDGWGELSLPENEGAADPSLWAEDGSALVQDVPPGVEQEDRCGPQTEESAVGAVDGSGGPGDKGCCGEAVPSQASPSAELPRGFGEGTGELGGDDGDLPMIDAEMPREEELEHSQEPGELPETGGEAKQEPEAGEQAAGGVDVAGEPEDSVFRAGELDFVPGSTWEEKDAPLEGCEAGSQEPEGAAKVSPLTSVADLGEIVLDEDLLVHESLPVSDLESCQGDGASRLRDPTWEEPSGNQAGPDPSPEATVSVLKDGMKDILELVEQALEFNQEVIKAGGQGMEREQPVPEGGARNAPAEEEGPPVSTTLPNMEESQSFTDPSPVSSPRAKDPPEATPSWTESATNGLPPDLPSPDFPAEFLNGTEEFAPANAATEDGLSWEEPAKKVTQQGLEEEGSELSSLGTLALSPPGSAEVLRPGEGAPEEVSVSHEGPEVPDADGHVCANTLKGKGAELEGVSAHFGEEILCLESAQPLKHRPEDGPELWFADGN